jgi:hypothetical protein
MRKQRGQAMTSISFPVLAAWADAAIFAAVGMINFTAPKNVLDMYEQWDVASGLYRTLGVIEIMAAVCLATPSLRVWGLMLAGPIAFGSVVMLLDQQKYRCAAAGVVIVAGLFVVLFALPQKPQFVVMQPVSQVAIQTGSSAH